MYEVLSRVLAFFQAHWSESLALLLAVALVAGSLWMSARSNLLRDASASSHKAFSFSRVQLLWWVVVVALCVLWGFGRDGELDLLNPTAMGLMGLGIGTASVAQILDGRQRAAAEVAGTTVSQDDPSKDFFTDIMSDENGLSVHRFQALVFNIIYGVAFLTYFVHHDKFPNYQAPEFMALGLSSTGYLALKAFENDPKSPATATAKGAGDELTDTDTIPAGSAASG